MTGGRFNKHGSQLGLWRSKVIVDKFAQGWRLGRKETQPNPIPTVDSLSE
ncbi:hypothetical protein D082_26970 [Synechocystis sp. PCC 6714]|nr:hypothetical protein D082_26970 [Synechocystis sp. PCC 6714]